MIEVPSANSGPFGYFEGGFGRHGGEAEIDGVYVQAPSRTARLLSVSFTRSVQLSTSFEYFIRFILAHLLSAYTKHTWTYVLSKVRP